MDSCWEHNTPAFFSVVLSVSCLFVRILSFSLFLCPFRFVLLASWLLCFLSMLWPVPFLLPLLFVSPSVWKEDFMTSGTDPTGVGNEEWPVNLPVCLSVCLPESLLAQCSCNQITRKILTYFTFCLLYSQYINTTMAVESQHSLGCIHSWWCWSSKIYQ